MATKGKGTSGKRGSTSKPPKRTHSTRHAEAAKSAKAYHGTKKQ